MQRADGIVSTYPVNMAVCNTATWNIYCVGITMPALDFVLQMVVIVHGCGEAN